MHHGQFIGLEFDTFAEIALRATERPADEPAGTQVTVEHAERIQSQVPDSDPTAQAVANSLRIKAATANAMAATVEQPAFQSEG